MVKPNLFTEYQKLLNDYGDPINYWPQWCSRNKSIQDREKIIIGMILCQKTSWHNANLALKNLKTNNLFSLQKIADLKSLDQLTHLIRPSGFYQSKPQRLFDVCSFIVNHGGIKKVMTLETTQLRSDLLTIKGVGPETADTILLYALDKPIFIIDEYTRRWSEKNGLTPEKDYLKFQQLFHHQLSADLINYQNFHALIIICQRGREKSLMEIL